jgi:hypothetical protein
MTKSTYFFNLIFGAAVLAISSTASAQAPSQPTAAAARGEVRLERDEFLKTHRYDEVNSDWIPHAQTKSDLSRAEVKIARDKYLSTHRWDKAADAFTPITEAPRDMSTMSRDAVKMETLEFVRTHKWDSVTSAWVNVPARAKK